jgi:uncharacterized membrane protein
MGLTFGALHLVYGMVLSFAAVSRSVAVMTGEGSRRATVACQPTVGCQLSQGSTLAAALTDE